MGNWKNSVNVLVESFEKLSWSMLCNGFGLSIACGAGRRSILWILSRDGAGPLQTGDDEQRGGMSLPMSDR